MDNVDVDLIVKVGLYDLCFPPAFSKLTTEVHIVDNYAQPLHSSDYLTFSKFILLESLAICVE